jgi:nitrate/nitrite-specific signal transduction histidine kinase
MFEPFERELTMERPVSTRRLTILYIIALSLIGLLTITGQIVVQQSLWQLTGDATVVNHAGRQRMISQRLAKLILASAVSRSLENRMMYSRDLQTSLSQWEIAQRGLRFGETSLQLAGNNSPIVNEMLKALQPDFDATCQQVRDVIELLQTDAPNATLRSDLESKAALIMATTERFLTGMDAIVAQYEHEAQRRVAQLRRTERGLLIATLLVLLAEGCLVFYPAVDRFDET